MYDYGGFQSDSEKSVFTIVVGNLSTGGTGKTPMCLYLMDKLKSHHQVAYLSRGYGRKSKGFIWVHADGKSSQVGDEALMIKQKNLSIPVAVCENRVVGVKKILKEHKQVNCIILDDAFQHRKFKADRYILLTTFEKPFFKDYLLPSGNLREARKGASRADLIVVSKCPKDILDSVKQMFKSKISHYSQAEVFFTEIDYDVNFQVKKEIVLAVSALANSTAFESFLKAKFNQVEHLSFKDHHPFTLDDIKIIRDKANQLNAQIVCTEKDWVKIREFSNSFPDLDISVLVIKQNFIENEEMFLNRLHEFIVS